jgi:hypothetical protein
MLKDATRRSWRFEGATRGYRRSGQGKLRSPMPSSTLHGHLKAWVHQEGGMGEMLIILPLSLPVNAKASPGQASGRDDLGFNSRPPTYPTFLMSFRWHRKLILSFPLEDSGSSNNLECCIFWSLFKPVVLVSPRFD